MNVISKLGFLFYALPPGVWLYFVFSFGNDTTTIAWGCYIFSCPLILYLLFFSTYFQPSRTVKISIPGIHRFRTLCLIFIAITLIDGLGTRVDSYFYQKMADHDQRYNLFFNHWLKQRDFHLPPASGDTEPGPFMPGTSGSMVRSGITVDRFGFRREVPDPWPDLSPENTFNVLCLGGSVMFGMTVEKEDFPAPDLLQEMVLQTSHKNPIRVYNGGYPGEHIVSINKYIRPAFSRIRPHIVFFYEAINWLAPSQQGFLTNRNSLLMTWFRNLQVKHHSIQVVDNYSPVEFNRALDRFIHECQSLSPSAIPVLMTFSLPFSLNNSARQLHYWDQMQNGQGCARAAATLVDKHNQCILQMAQKYSLPVIDTRPTLNGKADLFIDSCHLTQQGNRFLAELMRRKIDEILTPTNN